jgi:hypothetical protein
VCDDNVRTININRKEWVRKTADHNSIKKREKSVIHYHKLADIIKTSRSQYASAGHKFSKVHFMVLSYSAQVQVTDFWCLRLETARAWAKVVQRARLGLAEGLAREVERAARGS